MTFYLLSDLENKKYISHLEYAHAYNDYAFDGEWDRYREIFDQCVNLKAIELRTDMGHVLAVLPTLPEDEQEAWNKRISYFQARGIRLANKNEISDNEHLRTKLAKLAGATWRFHFEDVS